MALSYKDARLRTKDCQAERAVVRCTREVAGERLLGREDVQLAERMLELSE